jgi:DNA-binding MarR family transcriptional regulator
LSGLNVDLAQQHYFTLRVVAQRGPLPVADVAERSGVDHTQASKRLKRLEELRLAERGTDSFDRRSTLFRCTRRGTTLERRIVSTQIGVLEEAIYPVSTPGDRKQWSELVIRYRAAMERAGAQFEI